MCACVLWKHFPCWVPVVCHPSMPLVGFVTKLSPYCLGTSCPSPFIQFAPRESKLLTFPLFSLTIIFISISHFLSILTEGIEQEVLLQSWKFVILSFPGKCWDSLWVLLPCDHYWNIENCWMFKLDLLTLVLGKWLEIILIHDKRAKTFWKNKKS